MGTAARDVSGGIRRLSDILAEYERQIEYDLRVHCKGIDLRDLWRPGGGASKLTFRLLGVLLDGLPGDSAYKTAVRDGIPDEQLATLSKAPRDTHGTWSHTDLLLASLIDLIGMQVRGLQPAGDFEPYPRPGIARRAQAQQKRTLSAEGRAYLQKIREEHERANGYGIGAEAG